MSGRGRGGFGGRGGGAQEAAAVAPVDVAVRSNST